MELYIECDKSQTNTILNNGKYYISAGQTNYKKTILKSPIYFDKNQKVPDDYERGYLIHNGKDWDLVLPQTYSIIKKVRIKTVNRLALIIESPHKDEFDKVGNTYFPLLPAMGETGLKIRGGITERNFINQLDKKCDYQVALINAVQYQCSCCNYIPNINKIFRDLTDQVFYLLFQQLKGDFINRLINFKPDFIVNACTIGGTGVPKKSKDFSSYLKANQKFDLRGMVSSELKSNKIIFIPDKHPLNW